MKRAFEWKPQTDATLQSLKPLSRPRMGLFLSARLRVVGSSGPRLRLEDQRKLDPTPTCFAAVLTSPCVSSFQLSTVIGSLVCPMVMGAWPKLCRLFWANIGRPAPPSFRACRVRRRYRSGSRHRRTRRSRPDSRRRSVEAYPRRLQRLQSA